MKKLFTLFLLGIICFSIPTYNNHAVKAQTLKSVPAIVTVAALPATCVAVGSSTSSAPVRYLGRIYTCTATNTWTAMSVSDATLTALAAYNTNGLLTQTAPDTFTGRTITGTTDQVLVSNGNGVSGNPTLSLPQAIATSSNFQAGIVSIGTSATGQLLNINSATSANAAVNFSINAVTQGFWGVSGANDNIIVGSLTGDQVFRAQGKNFLFSTDSGTSPQLKLATTGASVFSGSLAATSYRFTNLLSSATAPTVTSAGTSPSITANNGTAAFIVNVGTGGTATTIVLGLPTAAAGWICHATNVTATAANRADQSVRQTASSTTSATLQNQTVSTGAALAFTASDLVRCQCTAY